MHDTELYQHVLGSISPWGVSNVDLKMELGEIVLSVSHPNVRKQDVGIGIERVLPVY